MKQIMIVDDEVLIRTGIQALVNGKENGYQVVAEASNGREAINELSRTQPDIVLTDLKMYPVDGLELIRYISKTYPKIVVIVLSNLNDFENVRKAMKYGACDYISKFTVNPKDFIDTINDAVKNKANDLFVSTDTQKTDQPYRNPDFLQHNVNSTESLPEMAHHIAENSKKVDFNSSFRLLYICIENYNVLKMNGIIKNEELFRESVKNILNQNFSRRFATDLYIYSNSDFLVFLNDEGIILKKYYETARKSIRQMFDVELCASVSGNHRGSNEIETAVQECTKLQKNLFHYPDRLVDKSIKTDAENSQLLQTFLEKINQYTEARDYINATLCMKEALRKLDTMQNISKNHAFEFISKMFQSIFVLARKYNIELINVEVEGFTLTTCLHQFNHYNDCKKILFELLDVYRQKIEDALADNVREEVREVQKYIMEHFDEQINLSDVSKLVHMSESRLSHVFKNETGVTFIEYLSNLRMNAAEKMLRSKPMTISDIALKTGFGTQSYFSSQFRKKYGISPLQYRKNVM